MERRLFRDEQGRFRFLLEEKLGWKKGKCATPDFLKLVAQLSTGLPYRQVEEILSLYAFPPSHAMIQKMVTSLGEEKAREEKEKRTEMKLVYSLLISQDLEGVLNHLQKIEEEVTRERKKEIGKLTRYILSKSSGLSDYQEKFPQKLQGNLRPLGAAESNMDKIIANRNKKRGMSWSKRGANSLAKVIALRENGELEDCIT